MLQRAAQRDPGSSLRAGHHRDLLRGGGKCDASEQASLMLRDSAGIAGNKLFVYTGGMTEWKEKNLPIETGSRNSGKLMDGSHGK
jgi:hypothetical protein